VNSSGQPTLMYHHLRLLCRRATDAPPKPCPVQAVRSMLASQVSFATGIASEPPLSMAVNTGGRSSSCRPEAPISKANATCGQYSTNSVQRVMFSSFLLDPCAVQTVQITCRRMAHCGGHGALGHLQ
jgi:hypothetical protein